MAVKLSYSHENVKPFKTDQVTKSIREQIKLEYYPLYPLSPHYTILLSYHEQTTPNKGNIIANNHYSGFPYLRPEAA